MTSKGARIAFAIITSIFFLFLLGCIITSIFYGPSKGSKGYEKNTFLLEVPGKQDLYYDPDEKVVYMIFNECEGYSGYGYMSPYYSHNGYPYLYDSESDSLIEIKGAG